jgi:hypothetical protein
MRLYCLGVLDQNENNGKAIIYIVWELARSVFASGKVKVGFFFCLQIRIIS